MTEVATNPTNPQMMGPFNPHSAFISDVMVGDLISFDAFFGVELVIEVYDQKDLGPGGSKVRKITTQWALPTGESNMRFINRASHEPTTRWLPVIPS